MVLALTLAATALRLNGLFGGELHADEALFASWARLIATWRDPLLRSVVVDKPPFAFYLQAAVYPLMGLAEPWLARLPNLLASILIIPLTGRLVWNVYGDAFAAVLASAIAAASPLLIKASAAAFLDPTLTVLALASLVAASGAPLQQRSLFFAGLLLGLGAITKFQGLLFIPLHLFLLWWRPAPRHSLRPWQIGLALPLLAALGWLALRGQGLNLWALQMHSFGGLRLAWSWEIWPRLEAWAGHWQQLIGQPVLLFALLLLAPLFLALLIQRQDRQTALDQLFLLFLVAFASAHWLIAVPVWERYILAPAPIASLLAGRFLSRVGSFLQPASMPQRRSLAPLVAVAVIGLLFLAGVTARGASGETRQADSAAAAVAQALSDAPYGTVLYDHWYSWQWRAHLMDSKVYVSWFSHPGALIDDLDAFIGRGDARYVVLPRAAPGDVVRRYLHDAGYRLEAVLQTEQMNLYRITP